MWVGTKNKARKMNYSSLGNSNTIRKFADFTQRGIQILIFEVNCESKSNFAELCKALTSPTLSLR
jgi:hypothetical protein